MSASLLLTTFGILLASFKDIFCFCIINHVFRKTILTSIVKLNDQNWHTWNKEMEAYLTMEDLWGVIDPTEPTPTSAAAIKHDNKAYVHIWFMVVPGSQDLIIEMISGHKAMATLKTKHEKRCPVDSNELSPTFLCALSQPCCWYHDFCQ